MSYILQAAGQDGDTYSRQLLRDADALKAALEGLSDYDTCTNLDALADGDENIAQWQNEQGFTSKDIEVRDWYYIDVTVELSDIEYLDDSVDDIRVEDIMGEADGTPVAYFWGKPCGWLYCKDGVVVLAWDIVVGRDTRKEYARQIGETAAKMSDC